MYRTGNVYTIFKISAGTTRTYHIIFFKTNIGNVDILQNRLSLDINHAFKLISKLNNNCSFHTMLLIFHIAPISYLEINQSVFVGRPTNTEKHIFV